MIAVLATFFSSVTLLVYGAIVVVDIVIDLVQDGTVSSTRAKLLAVEMIEMIDVFLLGTVLYIVSLGLHSLFIEPNLKMPEWLRVETIDDLKARIVGVVIVLLAVTFLADAVTWDSGRDIIYFGVAIAIVILALGISNYTTFLVHSKGHHDE